MKRFLDIAIIALFAPFLLFLIVIVSILIFCKLGSPILFKQVRPGIGGQPFKMYKFRTMANKRNNIGNLLPDVERLTRFGLILRSTSLDELPELWNVIKGEMSLIGPRPLLMEYLPLYSKEQFRRHDVLPGITGWAQINGRNAISWEEKFTHDIWYVDNHSFVLDLQILFLTAIKVFKREGIAQGGEATVKKFEGSNE